MAPWQEKGSESECCGMTCSPNFEPDSCDSVLMEKNEKAYLLREIDPASGRPPRQSRMAIPRPIRILAAACMILFFFLMVQIMRSPTTIDLPGSGGKTGKDKYASFVRDPNLDGMAQLPELELFANMLYRDRRTSRAFTKSTIEQLRPRQRTQ